jgi:hypothetical protein
MVDVLSSTANRDRNIAVNRPSGSPSPASRRSQAKADGGELSRLGSGERNQPGRGGPPGPSKRARASQRRGLSSVAPVLRLVHHSLGDGGSLGVEGLAKEDEGELGRSNSFPTPSRLSVFALKKAEIAKRTQFHSKHAALQWLTTKKFLF